MVSSRMGAPFFLMCAAGRARRRATTQAGRRLLGPVIEHMDMENAWRQYNASN